MYLRFTGPGTVTRARVAPGLFGPAYHPWWDGFDKPDAILLAIRHELDWFNEWLPAPTRLAVKARGRHWSDGVCWFRAEAREMVAHAFTLAALIEECGVPIARVWTQDPGQALYRDHWQVVAKPEPRMLACRRRSPRPVTDDPEPVGTSISSHRRGQCRNTATNDDQPCFRADQQAA
jgi:hypothetical protein